jgi:bacterioferritin
MTPVTREQIIELLKQDLVLEYQAALQYIQHYAVMQGAQFDSIRLQLLEHSEQEIGHAVKIADRINYMGGVPGATAGPTKMSPDAMQMLAQDLEGEQTAIARYKERVAQAQALGEYGLSEVIQNILVDEEEHENDLKTTIGTFVVTKPQDVPVAAPQVAAPGAQPVRQQQAIESPLANPAYDPQVMARFASLRGNRKRRSNI